MDLLKTKGAPVLGICQKTGFFSLLIPLECWIVSSLLKLLRCYYSTSCNPTGVGYVHQLRELDLSFNQLADIPATIEECAELRVLKLTNNKLTSAPATSLESLEELRVLELSGNQIEELPAEVSDVFTCQLISMFSVSYSRVSIKVAILYFFQ